MPLCVPGVADNHLICSVIFLPPSQILFVYRTSFLFVLLFLAFILVLLVLKKRGGGNI